MESQRTRNRWLLVLALVFSTNLCAKGRPGQRVPDAKRQHEIRQALVEHGYKSGKTWSETQEILRDIAREHHWQHTHAPDARVLILLGLGNKYSDPQVLEMPLNRLEEVNKKIALPIK